jgi:hypothetical protein
MEHVLLSCSNLLFRDSSIKTYNIGESGHPCLKPLETLKKGAGLPFIKGAIQGVEMQALIQEIKD